MSEPIAYLIWLQGRPAIDDVVDYYEVARHGDKCVDGSEPFPVYGADALAAKDAEIKRLREALSEVAGYDRNFYDNGRPGYEAIARDALSNPGSQP